eukprot:3404216-Prymnesium_polylepis.1
MQAAQDSKGEQCARRGLGVCGPGGYHLLAEVASLTNVVEAVLARVLDAAPVGAPRRAALLDDVSARLAARIGAVHVRVAPLLARKGAGRRGVLGVLGRAEGAAGAAAVGIDAMRRRGVFAAPRSARRNHVRRRGAEDATRAAPVLREARAVVRRVAPRGAC